MNLTCLSTARRDSMSETPNPPGNSLNLLKIIFWTCRNVKKSRLVTPNLFLTCWNVRIESSWIKSPTLGPLSFQSARPPRRPWLSWRGVNRERWLPQPSSFLIYHQLFSIFFKIIWPLTKAETFAGDIYSKLCRTAHRLMNRQPIG